MTVKQWKRLSRFAKLIKYRVNRKLGLWLQDIVDDLYPA